MKTIEHQQEFVIRSYEIDQNGKATLPHIANYFQEAAGLNARDLNFDIEDLHKQNNTWVLYRLHIRIDRFPERWQPVMVHTWPSSGDGIRAFRDYELLDSQGNTLGVGISQWMVLNITNRRPVRIPREVMEMGLGVKEHQLPVDKEPFDSFDDPDFETTIITGRHDLDMNRHVNNVKYIEWMIGYVPESFSKSKRCSDLHIQYHKESKMLESLSICGKQIEQGLFLHKITNTDSGDLLATGTSTWRV